MPLPILLQGRLFRPEPLAQMQALLEQKPDWSRHRLSREVARLWDWRTPQGQLKDMAARTLLLNLQAQGWIGLPPRRRKSPTRSGRAPVSAQPPLEQTPIACALREVLPLQVREVSGAADPAARRPLETALHQHHYLGYRSRVGQNLLSGGRSAGAAPGVRGVRRPGLATRGARPLDRLGCGPTVGPLSCHLLETSSPETVSCALCQRTRGSMSQKRE